MTTVYEFPGAARKPRAVRVRKPNRRPGALPASSLLRDAALDLWTLGVPSAAVASLPEMDPATRATLATAMAAAEARGVAAIRAASQP